MTDEGRSFTSDSRCFSADRVTPTEVYQRNHNPVFTDDFFTPTVLHPRDHKPVIAVEKIPFELTCSLRQAKPLFKPQNLELVRCLVAEHPNATLKQLCGMVEQKKGFRVAISSMHRAQVRLGLRKKDRFMK